MEVFEVKQLEIEFENKSVVNLTASRISLKSMRKTRIFQKDTYISINYLNKEVEVLKIKNQFTFSTSWFTKMKPGDTCRFHQHHNCFYSGLYYFDDYEENDDFYYKNLELEDLKQWLIKGIWYFDKKYSELIYRPIGLAPVTKPLQKNDDDDFLGGPLDNTYEPPPVNGPDSDGDGIGDQDEIDGFETDPQVADSDGDGFNDGDEINKFFTDPLNPNEFPSESDVADFDNPSPDPEPQTDTAASAISKLRPIFWVYYPHAREILKKGQAFNNRNTSKLSLIHI